VISPHKSVICTICPHLVCQDARFTGIRPPTALGDTGAPRALASAGLQLSIKCFSFLLRVG
jgi:hypothetical protein